MIKTCNKNFYLGKLKYFINTLSRNKNNKHVYRLGFKTINRLNNINKKRLAKLNIPVKEDYILNECLRTIKKDLNSNKQIYYILRTKYYENGIPSKNYLAYEFIIPFINPKYMFAMFIQNKNKNSDIKVVSWHKSKHITKGFFNPPKSQINRYKKL